MNQKELDGEKLRQWINNRKILAFEYGRDLATINSDQIKHYGHQTREAALVHVFTKAMSEINGRIRAFEAKYPN